jgi:hypothetical protein
MKNLTILVFTFFSFNIFAEQKDVLAQYTDCASSTNYVSDHLPIFTKVGGKKVDSAYLAGDFTHGLAFAVSTDSKDEIKKIHIGEKLSFTVEDFEKGLEFGLGSLTAHTIQLVDFHPESGGTLQFGFLKQFSAKKQIVIESINQNVNEYYTSLYGSNWGAHEVYLVRNNLTNKWEIQNKAQDKVSAIFGIMNMKYGLFVFGITEMLNVTVNNSEVVYVPNKVTTLKKGDKIFRCEY